MLVVESPAKITLVKGDSPQAVVAAEMSQVVLSGTQVTAVVQSISSTVVAEVSAAANIQIISHQGSNIVPTVPIGVAVINPGGRGPSGTSAIVTNKSNAFGGQRLIALSDTEGFVYADPASPYPVIGFTPGAVSKGEIMELLTSGNLNGFTGLEPAKVIFLGPNGTITQEPPTSGYLQVLGIALTKSKINIQIQQQIFIG